MVFYPIQTLVRSGIKDIMIVVGGPHAGHFLRVLKNGRGLGINHLEYAFQEEEGGIAEALSLCEDFSDRDNITVILGDNCTDANIKKAVQDFKTGATIFLKEVPDPKRFGVPIFNQRQKIVRIEEKPKKPKSNYAVTGLYVYDKTVFNKIRRVKPSTRGELEITDVNNLYVKSGKLNWAVLDGFWSDAGTFDSLYRTSQYWARKCQAKKS